MASARFGLIYSARSGADCLEFSALTDRLRKVVEEKLLVEVVGLEPRPVTVSMGLTAVQDRDNSIDDVIKRADDALYRAKQMGRNRVEVCGERARR